MSSTQDRGETERGHDGRKADRRRADRKARLRRELSFQGLERRLMPTTFVITTAADSGPGSLRAAILSVDADATPDVIQFTIGTGAQSIALTAALPTVTNSVTIDGTTQPGYSGTPLIELNGAGAGASVDGLVLSAGNSAVKALVVNRFSGSGIVLLGSNDVITGSYIGTDAAGAVARPNAAGVLIQGGATGDTVGGLTANPGTGAGNVISGNTGAGVTITDAGTAGNQVQGNLIGTDAGGTAPLANATYGVLITTNAATNTIGGIAAGSRNIVSGNADTGVFISNTSGANFVRGNYIGTDVTGAVAVPNQGGVSGGGVKINFADNQVIGGTTAAERNVISGNARDGLILNSISSITLQGNYIGTNAAGTGPLGNALSGVATVGGASGITIGGTAAGAGNVISGNSKGIDLGASSGNFGDFSPNTTANSRGPMSFPFLVFGFAWPCRL